MVSSRPPNLQKTKEKLKNPQQPNTQALESQEGLKHICLRRRPAAEVATTRISRRVETVYREYTRIRYHRRLESQEGLKLSIVYRDVEAVYVCIARISRRVETLQILFAVITAPSAQSG